MRDTTGESVEVDGVINIADEEGDDIAQDMSITINIPSTINDLKGDYDVADDADENEEPQPVLEHRFYVDISLDGVHYTTSETAILNICNNV